MNARAFYPREEFKKRKKEGIFPIVGRPLPPSKNKE